MPGAHLEKEVEELRESNHRLKLTIESSKQIHQNELEFLKDELQIKEKELQSLLEKLKTQKKKQDIDIEEKFVSLNEVYNVTREENTDLKSQVLQLQRTLEQLRTAQADRHTFHEDNESLKIQNDQLNIDLKNARDILEKQQSKVHELTQQVLQQKVSMGELRDELESRDSYIAELQSRMKELEKDKQDAIMELQHTLMLQQNARQEAEDPNRRGNSLFSEVEERRVRVEEELVRLRERVVRLTTENHELQATIEKGDSRSGIILQQVQVMQRNDTDVVKEFRKLQSETLPKFNQYRDRLDALKAEYIRKLGHYRNGDDSPLTGELETLRQERDLLLGQKMGLDQELWEVRKELKYVTHQWTEEEAKCKIFRTKLQELQEAVMSGSDKHKGEGDGSVGSLLNQTAVANGEGNRKCLYDSIMNDSRCVAQAQAGATEIPLSVSRKAKSNVVAVPSAKKLHTESEDIPECNQQ